MINMVEPRGAADADSVTSSDSLQDGELTSLIRRWMAAGSKVQDRVRRDSILRVAPDPDSPQPGTPESETSATEDLHTEVVLEEAAPEEAALEEAALEEATPAADTDAVDAEAVDEEHAPVVGTSTVPASDVDDVIDDSAPGDVPAPEPVVPASSPPLPRRSTGGEAEKVHRVALLIDARRVSADVATGLLQRLAERGSVNVCRAYADWSRAELGDWVGQLRREGMHSFHHYSEDDDQALVAMTIDAVDIARDAAVDEVVIAGDLTSALPLVHRLHAAGVRVVAVGPGHTPHDVRAACHEFIDTGSFDGTQVAPTGRHRA